MLSKLRRQVPDKGAVLQKLAPVVRSAFPKSGAAVAVRPLENAGTLGLCYLLDRNGETLFVKTHLPGRVHQAALVKEAVLLRKLYGDALLHEVVSVETTGGSQTLLVMAYLQPLDGPPTAGTLAGIIAAYNAVFSTFSHEESALIPPDMADFSGLLGEAENALKALAEQDFFQQQTVERCTGLLTSLRSAANGPRILCHGDLSNKNILQENGRLFVIDWEDAFWGIPNYDFYYWMTFFDQRGLYTRQEMNRLPVQDPHGMGMMAAAVLVKCFMATLDGSYKKYSMSFEDRLCEILALEAST